MLTSNLPKSVLLRENGPREGFQIHPQFVPTEKKLELIRKLSETGVKEIEVTSFVRPDRVPQLADAEDLLKLLPPKTGVQYTALSLNIKGLERSFAFSNIKKVGFIHLASSESFLKSNNNISFAEAYKQVEQYGEIFREKKYSEIEIILSCAFGDYFEGEITATKNIQVLEEIIKRLSLHGVSPTVVNFADTIGWANPIMVEKLIKEFQEKIQSKLPQAIPALHFHDSRGLGLTNILAGLNSGVKIFDAAVAGLGGCPFTPGAAGNVPTEDVAFLCEELGINTGLDLEKYIDCAKFAEEIIGKSLPGKLKNSGLKKIKKLL